VATALPPARSGARRSNGRLRVNSMNKIQTIIGSAAASSAGFSQWSLAVLVAACLAAVAATGCRSAATQEPLRFASVVIHGQPHERVRDVTAEVFLEHGYRVARNGWADLIFEREGSTMNNLAYGTLMSGRVWVRVKASVVDNSPGTCRLACEAFVLQNRGEALEEEIRITKIHNRPYQELLDEVAKRLSGTTTNAVPAKPGI
jgi:hypothetical protein